MATKDRVVREVGLRLRLILLGFFCSIGAGLLVVAVAWLWASGHQPFALLLASVWLVSSLPWLLLALLAVGDTLLFLSTGSVAFFPMILRLSDRERDQRILVGRTLRQGRAFKRLLEEFSFYTNPLIPYLIGLSVYLAHRPIAEDVVAMMMRRMDERRPVVRSLARNVAEPWGHATGRAA